MVTVRVSGGVELDADQYAYLSDLGERGANKNDVGALRELQAFFEENDATEKADSLNSAVSSAIAGITGDAMTATGQSITYYPDLYGGQGGWRNDDSGLFIGKLDINIDTDNPTYLDELSKRILNGQGE